MHKSRNDSNVLFCNIDFKELQIKYFNASTELTLQSEFLRFIELLIQIHWFLIFGILQLVGIKCQTGVFHYSKFCINLLIVLNGLNK